jgi:putative spermidine/putrescine transport system ATP-binding protein
MQMAEPSSATLSVASASNESSFVRFRGVQKSYDGETLVVKDLNLDIVRGEFLTLLGPSGSGKTTTLMMLAGFEAPTHGHIELGNRDITSVPPHKRNIGMVFQNYALFPHMSVAENIAFPLKVRGQSRGQIDEKVSAALEMVRLPEFARRRPGQLSGGQQQRVAVARALVFDPDLVLMDEPLGALDKNLREELQYEIKRIHEDTHITVVYVTHDQSEALTMSSRVAVFDDGIIQQIGAPKTIYDAPDNAFVAAFIGENNRLEGKIVAHEQDGKIAHIALSGSDTVIRAANICAAPLSVQRQVSIRPERVQLNPSQTEGMENSVRAEVRNVIYLGDHIRVVLSTLGRDDFVVKVANSGWDRSHAVGDTLELGFSSNDARALDG